MLDAPAHSGFSAISVGGKYWPIGLLALVTWISIVICLDPGGSYPGLPEGPGLTVDEIFNYEQGVYLVEQALNLGWLNLMPGTSQEAYRKENGYNPDHPPLGRWWLGVHHHLAWWLAPPLDPAGPYSAACARTGSATAFALTVLLIGCCATAWWGRATGVMTALSLICMPRLYGHAHLASLETITNLTCTAAVLVIAYCWEAATPPRKRDAVFAGLVMGLALLTKIQAILIPIPVIVWACWRWRFKALVPITIWSFTAFVVLFLNWPYLWFDPVGHVFEYLGRTTNRASISVWYFGQKYADKLVPWHYPFVIFALTVPAWMLLLKLWGLVSAIPPADPAIGGEASPSKVNDQFRRDSLLLGCALFPLIVFAIPGVAVYDGERLFLTVFPLSALFIGRGWMACWQRLVSACRSRWFVAPIWLLLLASMGLPVLSTVPYHLCYYNSAFFWRPLFVDAASLEVDYWGVGITRGLLERLVQSVPAGSRIALVPTLHQFQAEELVRQSPVLRRHRIVLTEYREDDHATDFVLVYRRRADLPDAFNQGSVSFEIIEATQIGKLPLAYLARRVR